jgi:hypothetical protein
VSKIKYDKLGTQESYPFEVAEILQKTGFNTPLSEQPQLFLNGEYGVWRYLPDDGIIGLSYIAENLRPRQIWQKAADRLNINLTKASKFNSDPNLIAKGGGAIYWNGASRDLSLLHSGKRGGADLCLNVSAFWADIDTVKDTLVLNDVFDLIMQLLLKPTFVIASGGGIQLVHVLSEPWNVATDDNRNLYKLQAKALYERLSAIYDPDVLESARMMRLPGFRNIKRQQPAQILYHNPVTYTIAQIRETAPFVIPEPRQPKPRPETPDGVYAVDGDFIDVAVNGVHPADLGWHKHDAIYMLAQRACFAGMDKEAFTDRLYKLTFVHEIIGERGENEIDDVIEWGFKHPKDSSAVFRCRYTENGFEQIDTLVPTQTIEVELPDEDFNSLRDGLTRDELRTVIAQEIDNYLTEETKNIGLWLDVSTGGGKSTAMWKAGFDAAKAGEKIVFSTLNAEFNSITGANLLEQELGKDFAAKLLPLISWFDARNENAESQGYCGNLTKANLAAKKQYRTPETVCITCPLWTSCRATGYLSQKPRFHHTINENGGILVLRPEQAFDPQLLAYTSLLLVDESVFQAISREIIYTAKDLTPRSARLIGNEGELLQGVNRLLETMRNVTGYIPLATNIEAAKNAQFLGYDFINTIAEKFGKNELAKLAKQYLEASKRNHDKTSIETLTSEDVNQWPVNVKPLLDIFFDDDFQRYMSGETRWNSRIIPMHDKIILRPMAAIKVPRGCKIIVSDATANIDTLNKCFETPTGEPIIFRTARHKSKRKLIVKVYEDKRFTKSSLRLDTLGKGDKDSVDIAIIQNEILRLNALHKGSLLVASYKKLVLYLIESGWIEQNGLDQDNFTWFYAVDSRATNKWQDLEAVAVFGTPYMKPFDVLKLAQPLYYKEKALDFSPEKTFIPYVGYRDRINRGLSYSDTPNDAETPYGFKDKRLERVRVHAIQNQFQQIIGRIRGDIADVQKYAYVFSPFPPGCIVDEIVQRKHTDIDQTVRDMTEKLMQQSVAVIATNMVEMLDGQYGKKPVLAALKRVWQQMEKEGLGRFEMSFKANPNAVGRSSIAFLRLVEKTAAKKIS